MSSKGAIPADRVLTYLVPPDEDVLLTVTCSGGHKWPDGLDEGVLIHASPGATENITLPASCFEKGI